MNQSDVLKILELVKAGELAQELTKWNFPVVIGVSLRGGVHVLDAAFLAPLHAA